MKVKELIEQLKDMNQEFEVVSRIDKYCTTRAVNIVEPGYWEECGESWDPTEEDDEGVDANSILLY